MQTYPTRLKPLREDPLEALGLPSKGETGLTSWRSQEQYFNLLSDRARKVGLHALGLHSAQNRATVEGIEHRLDTLSIQDSALPTEPSERSQDELVTVLGAMRKLRESLVATKRYDAFTTEVYLFVIRSTIPLAHHEAYHPALTYALRVLAKRSVLPHGTLHELVTYAVLDLASRQDATRVAWETAWHHNLFAQADTTPRDLQQSASNASLRIHVGQIRKILQSATHLDLLTFHQCKQGLSGNEQVLLRPLERRLTIDAIACLSRAYFTAEVTYVEKLLNFDWSNESDRERVLIARATGSWHAEQTKVVFRRPKTKSSSRRD